MTEAGARPWARSDEKHRAIVRAAREVFLGNGYLGTNMDLIASRSGVSKQTVYTHFGSKEALFVEIVGSMTGDAGDRVHHERPELGDGTHILPVKAAVRKAIGKGPGDDVAIHLHQRR